MGEERDLDTILEIIETGNADYSDDERTIINAWVAKFREASANEAELSNTLDYAEALAKLITMKQQLNPPFHVAPPDELLPFRKRSQSQSQSKRPSLQYRRMPCNRPRTQPSPPKLKKPDKSLPPVDETMYNEFEDPEEMAKAVANSKGQTLAEFIASISRHTKDFGQKLRLAMKTETNSFRDYVDHVLSQRIKDLTEILDQEQNRELLKIKKDIDKWQMELPYVKRRIKEMIPSFDIVLYRKDPNYIKNQFLIDPLEFPHDDSFKRWQEENYHRLKWMADMTNKITSCNEQIGQQIGDVKNDTLELEAEEATYQQKRAKLIQDEIMDYQRLKQERDQLKKENADLLARIQDIEL